VNQRLGATGQAARAPLARKVFDAQSTYLDSEVRLTNEEIRAAHMETELSRARLALARQRNLARVGRVTGASLKPFEESVKAWEAASKAASVATTAVRTRAESDLDAWKTAEDEYARASGGDYDTVVWGD
jgi:precorrin-3B methylase